MEELQRLYGTLLEQDLISIDFNQFASKVNDKNYQDKVYSAVMEDDLYSGSFIDFQNKFFPTQVATTSTKSYVAPVTKTKEKSEKDLQIEQDAIDPEFWKGYTYTNPGVDEVGYNENYSTGAEVPLSREQYEKRINPETDKEQWVWVNPTNPNDIDYTLDERTTEELNREEIAIGNATVKHQERFRKQAINHSYWEEEGKNRQNYSKKDGKWVYTNPDDGTETILDETNPVLKELQKEDIEVQNLIIDKKYTERSNKEQKEKDQGYIDATQEFVNKYWEEVNDSEEGESINADYKREDFSYDEKYGWIYKNKKGEERSLSSMINLAKANAYVNPATALSRFLGNDGASKTADSRLLVLRGIQKNLQRERELERKKNKDYSIEDPQEILDNHDDAKEAGEGGILSSLLPKEKSSRDFWNNTDQYFDGDLANLRREDFVQNKDGEWMIIGENGEYTKLTPDQFKGAPKGESALESPDWISEMDELDFQLEDKLEKNSRFRNFVEQLNKEKDILEIAKKTGVTRPNINDEKYTDTDYNLFNVKYSPEYERDLRKYELEVEKLEIRKEGGDDIIQTHKERLELEGEKSRLLEELNVDQETLNTYEEKKWEFIGPYSASEVYDEEKHGDYDKWVDKQLGFADWRESEFYNEDYEKLLDINNAISRKT